MHPLLARYLDLTTALKAAGRVQSKAALNEDEQLFARVLTRDPDKARILLLTQGKPTPEAQQALVFFAAHAALEGLRADAGMSPALTAADLALRSKGASDAQVAAYLATLVLEEGFGYEDSPDAFDRPFFQETLESVPKLLTADLITIDRLVEEFAAAQPKARREEAERRARALLDEAWAEEPEPINPEHLEVALEDGTAEDARELGEFVKALAKEGFVGPLRQARLLDVLGLED